ncbi:MAG: prephenate dehydratase [Candidatus Micrarchaeota archaeon]
MNGTKLEKLRRKIDRIDAKFISLVAQRLETTENIGYLKRSRGAVVEDPARKAEVLERAAQLASAKDVRPEFISAIMSQMMLEAEEVQRGGRPTIAFQGERGAYSEAAGNSLFPQKIFIPCETFRQVFEAVESGEAQYAIVPIENSTEGSINEVYDLLLEKQLHIHAETVVQVRHCLMADREASLAEIMEVYTHPQALAQCRKFIEQKLPYARIIPFYDTAGAAKMIAENGKRNIAAIASQAAAKYYGLKELAAGIEDNRSNFTRFLLLSKATAEKPENPKTSLVFSLKHKPGALFSALRPFADKGINLTKIESRPTKGTPWEYLFYMDFEGDAREGKFAEAIEQLKEFAEFFKLLGVYEKAKRNGSADGNE